MPFLPPTASEQTDADTKRNIDPNDAYGTGQTSKLLILSECVDKTDKIGGTRRNTNSYRENEALSDISREIFLRHNCLMLLQSMKLLLGKHKLACVNMSS